MPTLEGILRRPTIQADNSIADKVENPGFFRRNIRTIGRYVKGVACATVFGVVVLGFVAEKVKAATYYFPAASSANGNCPHWSSPQEVASTSGSVSGGALVSCVVFDSNDRRHITYYNNGHIDYTVNGSSPVTLVPGDVWKGIKRHSLAIDSNDNLHLVYYVLRKIMYMNNIGGMWSSPQEILSGINPHGVSMSHFGLSIDIDSKGNYHLAYTNLPRIFEPHELKYTSSVSSPITIDGGEIFKPSIALDSNDKPHIAYYKDYVSLLHYDGESIQEMVTDITDIWGTGQYGFDLSIAMDSKNVPHLVYYYFDGPLLYQIGSSDPITIVPGRAFDGPNITFDSKDRAHVVYYDGRHSVKYLRQEPCTVFTTLDIRPGRCPNPVNLRSKGVLPVAILGTEDFDVGMIDIASIRLEGVTPIKSRYKDVATPADGNKCECSTEGPDGYTDLYLKFRNQDIVEELVNTYGCLTNGETLELTLTGALYDGNFIEGVDCVRIVGNWKPPPLFVDDDANGANNGTSWTDAYNNIQDAIDFALDCDTIIVADGVYKGEGNRDIDFLGKAITVRSENGPNNCIIDCENSGRGFNFDNAEDANSVLDGFTITNGESVGGGIRCDGSSPTIKNCSIIGNMGRRPPGGGGGIFCIESNPIITNCTISGNISEGIACFGGNPLITNCRITGNTYGGGIGCYYGGATITNCIITGNIAGEHGYGGDGIYCYYSNLTITNCTIAENQGSGIQVYNGSLTAVNCIITGNRVNRGGGGIACYEGSATITITNCTISENTGGESGGIYCEKASLVITDCIISKNTGEWSGGIWCAEGSLDITGCTIAGNSSEGEWALGGGISCWAVSPTITKITNCAIIGNSSKGTFSSGGGIFNASGSFFISNCIIAGNSAERGGGIIYGGGSTTITNCTITGNLANERGGGISIEGGDRTTIVNCTFAGNSALNGNAVACDSYEQCYPSDLFIMNSILWDGGNEIWNNDGSMIAITYSNVKDGWPGEGNIDADPCFVEPGYWDTNGTSTDANDDFWVEGDYYLLPNSLCIDAGDPNYIPEPNETDLDGNPRVINGRIDMGAYESNYTQAAMKLTPQMLNCNSKGKYVKAHFVLPEGFLPEDVDVNESAIAEPIGIESEYIKVLGAGASPVRLEICFDREAFCETITETGEVEITVIGSLTTSRYFYATDTIKIKP